MIKPGNSRKYSKPRDFTVYDRDKIVTIIEALASQNITLSLAYHSGADLVPSMVLAIDTENDVVYLDVNEDEALAPQLLSSKQVVLFAMLDGAIVEWSCTSIQRVEFEGRSALAIPIPRKLKHAQKRDAYRISTPVAYPAICHIPIVGDHEVALRLFDISIHGISVVLPPSLKPIIRKIAEFRNCRIEHPDLGDAIVNLVVHNIWNVTLRNGLKNQRAGFEFMELDAMTESKIQRFVFKLERRLMATVHPRNFKRIRSIVQGSWSVGTHPAS